MQFLVQIDSYMKNEMIFNIFEVHRLEFGLFSTKTEHTETMQAESSRLELRFQALESGSKNNAISPACSIDRKHIQAETDR